MIYNKILLTLIGISGVVGVISMITILPDIIVSVDAFVLVASTLVLGLIYSIKKGNYIYLTFFILLTVLFGIGLISSYIK